MKKQKCEWCGTKENLSVVHLHEYEEIKEESEDNRDMHLCVKCYEESTKAI